MHAGDGPPGGMPEGHHGGMGATFLVLPEIQAMRTRRGLAARRLEPGSAKGYGDAVLRGRGTIPGPGDAPGTVDAGEADPMIRVSQETIAIIGVFVTLIGVSVALGALIVATTGELRGEIQAVRDEIRDVRNEGRADREAIRAEGRAWRETMERRMARFEEHIIRLTEQQGALGGLVEGLRRRQPTAADTNNPPG